MALRLALICQAPTAATRTALFPTDEPLDSPGLAKARASAFRIGQSADCLSSPARASQQTAEALKLPARIEPALRECDYGAWAGRSFDDVHSSAPDGIALWLSDPSSSPHGGESVQFLLERVAAWLDTRGSPGQVVAITHASIIRAAIVATLRAPPQAFWRIDVPPLSVSRLRRSAGVWTLVSLNRPLGRAGGPRMAADV